jgi:hypothetical protein
MSREFCSSVRGVPDVTVGEADASLTRDNVVRQRRPFGLHSGVRPPRQPYALEVPAFPFASLATLAPRLPIGGGRELVLAIFAVVRLADDMRSIDMDVADRRERAANARKWLATLALPEPQKRALADLATASEGHGSSAAPAVRRVVETAGSVLDHASRSDLERLARDLETQAVART